MAWARLIHALPARHWIAGAGADVFAGVMVLSGVAQRLMIMSGSGASTSAAEYSQAAHQPIEQGRQHRSQRNIASPANRTRNFTKSDQASFGCPQSNDVPSTQIREE